MDFPLLIDAKNLILKILKLYEIKPDGNTTQDILRSYFNLKHKIIKSIKRSVAVSNDLLSKAQSLNVEDVLKIIETKFINGEDVNPFLSKGVFRSENHDRLLNDWQMHHLHLNAKKDKPSDYFTTRSKWLLFVHVTNDKVYFIDIRDHKEDYVFAQRDLLRIIRDNWPDLNSKFLINQQVMEVYPKLDEKDIATLRKKGYTFFTQVDNHAYFPGLGSASSGFSMLAGLQMDNFHRELYKIDRYTVEHKDDIIALLSKDSGIKITSLNFKLAFKDWTFYVYELNSKQFVNFDLAGYNPYTQSNAD